MTKKTRRKIDAVLKAKIALEALREQATVTELATLDAGRLLAFEDFDLREECWTCATAELRIYYDSRMTTMHIRDSVTDL